MKKIFAILSTFAVLAACTKAELSEPSSKTTEGTLVFTGSALQTKIAIGDKEGTAYKAIWEEGDVLSIVSAADASVLGTATLSEGAGENLATFVSNAAIADGTSVKLVYGAATIPATQAQAASGAKTLDGRTYAASETITISNSEPMTFTLVHTPAVVKVSVSSTEYASYKLEGVMIYSKGNVLAGTDSDFAEVNFTSAATLDNAQEAWLTTVPVTESSTFYVIAKISSEGKTYTIPVEFAGKTLQGGKVNSISLANLSAASCVSWYEPFDTRDNLGMYAYGAENTYFVEQKATDNAITFDVKARGDFRKVKQPKYYGLYTSTSQNGDGKYLFYLPNGTKVHEANPTTQVSANCEATVKCYNTGQLNKGHWATIAIYDKDYDLLWSFMLCRYLTNDPLGDVTYSEGFTLLDRPLGAAFSSAYILANGDKSGNNQYAFFEWGRKDPFMWSNSNISDRFNQMVVTNSTDIEYTIKHPGIIVGYTSSIAKGFWCTEMRNDLWGGQESKSKGYDTSLVGHKTIYDPCPAGYRVCDPKVFAAVQANAVHHESSNGNANQNAAWINPLTNCDSSYLTCTDASGNLDLWVFGGAHWGSNNNWGNRTGNTKNMGALYWSNSYYGKDGRGIMLQDCYFSSSISALDTYDSNMAQAYGVRCQKM